MTQKKMTIETLAEMINEGFKTTATKEDVKALEDRVTRHLDRIEILLMAEQKRKIEGLETRMKKLEDTLAVYEKVPRSKPPDGGFWLPEPVSLPRLLYLLHLSITLHACCIPIRAHPCLSTPANTTLLTTCGICASLGNTSCLDDM